MSHTEAHAKSTEADDFTKSIDKGAMFSSLRPKSSSEAYSHSENGRHQEAAEAHLRAAKFHSEKGSNTYRHQSLKTGNYAPLSNNMRTNHNKAAKLHREAAEAHKALVPTQHSEDSTGGKTIAHQDELNKLHFMIGQDARGREVHKTTSNKGINYRIEKMKTPGDVIRKTGKPSTHIMKYSGKGIPAGAALHSSLEDAIKDAHQHHRTYKPASQHEEEPELEPGHVSPQRAREIVDKTPGGWIRRES